MKRPYVLLKICAVLMIILLSQMSCNTNAASVMQEKPRFYKYATCDEGCDYTNHIAPGATSDPTWIDFVLIR